MVPGGIRTVRMLHCVHHRRPSTVPAGQPRHDPRPAARRYSAGHDDGSPARGLTQRADALLFMAARAQLVETVIEPALADGTIVISDRYLDSTLAYQGFGGQLGVDALLPVGRFATGGLRPDLTLLFDVPVDVGLARKNAAETTRFEAHFDRAFHERVRAGYLALAGAEPERWIVLDASAPEADVLAAASAAVFQRLGIALPTA